MSKKVTLSLAISFICIELIFYILILSGVFVVACEFAAVLSAFAFSMIFIKFSKDKCCLQLGLLFTVIADLFLVLLKPMNQKIAMTSFSLTQIFYFLKLLQQSESKLQNILNFAIRLFLVIAVEIAAVIVLKNNTDYVSLISLFYYVNLILNMIFAFIQFKKSPLFAIGLLLFLLCDTFVGFQMAFDVYIFISHNSFLYKLFTLPFNFIWFFYLPSQTLIALSLIKNIKINKN